MDQKESILIPVETEDFFCQDFEQNFCGKNLSKRGGQCRNFGGLSGTLKNHVISKVEQKIGIQTLNLLAYGQFMFNMFMIWDVFGDFLGIHVKITHELKITKGQIDAMR